MKLDQNILLDDYYSCLHTAHRSMENALELREADGLTQDHLAAMLGVDKALISRRMNGLENMTLRVMSFMGTAMKCRLVVAFEPYENSLTIDEIKSRVAPINERLEILRDKLSDVQGEE